MFINNDGNLFAYGEAIAGFLPRVNALLEEAGSAKRFRNLFGVTLGTGLGGGVIVDGRMLIGDNSNGGEACLLRHKLEPGMTTPSRARASAPCAAPTRRKPGPRPRTRQSRKSLPTSPTATHPATRSRRSIAFRRMGEVVGDVLAQALTLVDGLAVIGGGLAGAFPLFLPAVVGAMNGVYTMSDGTQQSRLVSRAFNLEDPEQTQQFLSSHARGFVCPGRTHRRLMIR